MGPAVKLLPNERLVYDARPHLLYFSLPASWGLMLLPLLLLHATSQGFFADMLRIILSVFLLVWTPWTLWHLLQWWFVRCVVSNYRVMWRRGVVSRSGVEIPLDRISNVNFHQTVLERIFGAGDLIIESSGQEGQSKFSDVRHPDDVQLLIHQQIVSARKEARPDESPTQLPPPSVPDDGILGQLRELESMRSRGLLTDEEFSAAKRRLLGH